MKDGFSSDAAEASLAETAAATIPRCSVLKSSKKHLDEAPLMLDKKCEAALLETLPPLKLVMMLQVWLLCAIHVRVPVHAKFSGAAKIRALRCSPSTSVS